MRLRFLEARVNGLKTRLAGLGVVTAGMLAVAVVLTGAAAAQKPAAPAAPAPAAEPKTAPPMAPGGMTPDEVVAYTLSKTKLPTAAPNTVPRKDGHPDFSGMWIQQQGILFSDPTPKHHSGSHPGWDDSLDPPPFTPEYAAKYKAFDDDVKKNGYNRAYECDPTGMPRIMANPFPMELIQTNDKLAMLFEYKSQIRRAYMDGRPHPDEDHYDSSFMGHSTAKWDGETLVIDTTRIKNADGKMIQITGIVHTDQLRVTENVRFLNKDRLEWEMTFIDPAVFSHPWVLRRSFARKSLSVDVPEYACLPSELVKELGYVKAPKPS